MNINIDIHNGKFTCNGTFAEIYGKSVNFNIYNASITGNTNNDLIQLYDSSKMLIDEEVTIVQNGPRRAIQLSDSSSIVIKGTVKNLNTTAYSDKYLSALNASGNNSIEIYNSTKLYSDKGEYDVDICASSSNGASLKIANTLTNSFSKIRIRSGSTFDDTEGIVITDFYTTNPSGDFSKYFSLYSETNYVWLEKNKTTNNIESHIFKIVDEPTGENPTVKVNVEGATYKWQKIDESDTEFKGSEIKIVKNDGGVVSEVPYDATKGGYYITGKFGYYITNTDYVQIDANLYSGKISSTLCSEDNIYFFADEDSIFKIKIDGTNFTSSSDLISDIYEGSYNSEKGYWTGEEFDIYLNSNSADKSYVLEFEGLKNVISNSDDNIKRKETDVYYGSHYVDEGLFKFFGHKKIVTDISCTSATLSNVSTGSYVCYVTYQGVTLTTEQFDYVKMHEHGTYGNAEYINYDNEIFDLEDFMSIEEGCYELESDITLEEDFTIKTNKIIHLCLNGHTINLGGHSIVNNGELYIDDCNTTNTTYISYDKTSKTYSISATETEYVVKGGIIMNGGDVAIDSKGGLYILNANIILNKIAVKTYFGEVYNFVKGNISFNKTGVYVSDSWFIYLYNSINIINNVESNIYLCEDCSISIDSDFTGKVSVSSEESNYKFSFSDSKDFKNNVSADSSDTLIVSVIEGEDPYFEYYLYIYDKCSLTYDDNVSTETITVPTDSNTYYYGQYATISTTDPERAGYIFKGWNTSKTATTALTDAKIKLEDDVTLYAVWEKKLDNTISSFTISSIHCGGTLSPQATAVVGTVTFTYSTALNGTYTSTVPTEVGTYYVKATSITNDAYYTQSKTEPFSISHSHPFTEFVWDGFEAEAKFVCVCSHYVTETATVTNAITTAPTCTNKGVRTYTAVVDDHTDTKTEEIAALGHDYTVTYSWNDNYSVCTANYVCSHDNAHKGTVTSKAVTVRTNSTEVVYTAIFDNSLCETQVKSITKTSENNEKYAAKAEEKEDNITNVELVEVELLEGNLDLNVVVVIADSSNQDIKAMNKELQNVAKGSEVVATFDIHLESNGVKVENIDGNIYKVTVSIPEEIKGKKEYQIIYIDEAGNMTIFNSTNDGNQIQFTTSHFSDWAIIAKASSSFGLAILIILLILILVVIGLYILWKYNVINTKDYETFDKMFKTLDKAFVTVVRLVYKKEALFSTFGTKEEQ